MWSKLEEVEKRYEEIGHKLTITEIISKREEFTKLTKEHKELGEIVATYRAYKKAEEELVGAKEMLGNAERDMVDMAKEEVRLLEGELAGLTAQLQLLLLPKDPNDDKSVIIEVS